MCLQCIHNNIKYTPYYATRSDQSCIIIVFRSQNWKGLTISIKVADKKSFQMSKFTGCPVRLDRYRIGIDIRLYLTHCYFPSWSVNIIISWIRLFYLLDDKFQVFMTSLLIWRIRFRFTMHRSYRHVFLWNVCFRSISDKKSPTYVKRDPCAYG